MSNKLIFIEGTNYMNAIKEYIESVNSSIKDFKVGTYKLVSKELNVWSMNRGVKIAENDTEIDERTINILDIGIKRYERVKVQIIPVKHGSISSLEGEYELVVDDEVIAKREKFSDIKVETNMLVSMNTENKDIKIVKAGNIVANVEIQKKVFKKKPDSAINLRVINRYIIYYKKSI